MKQFGCKSIHHRERANDLLRAYFQYLRACSKVSMPDVYTHVVNMPASRFWVSPSRALVAVSNILKGDRLLYMRPNKREMFYEIHRRVEEMQKKHVNLSLTKLIERVVCEPAPKFYIAPGSARAQILKAKKEWFEENTKRLKRLANSRI